MPAPERLVLFDIDGTLISAGDAPRRAFRSALIEAFGTEGDAATSDFSGKTDPQIVYELMLAAGFAEADIERRIEGLFRRYLDGLERELVAETRHFVFPGVVDLIDALDADPRVVMGLVTGNVQEGARLKLAHFGLWRRFSVGAFGSDDRFRDRLPSIAVDRAETLTGRRFKGREVVVIGDTPADIRCARAVDAFAVAVATGIPSRESLAAHAPDVLVDSLVDWRGWIDRTGVALESLEEGMRT